MRVPQEDTIFSRMMSFDTPPYPLPSSGHPDQVLGVGLALSPAFGMLRALDQPAGGVGSIDHDDTLYYAFFALAIAALSYQAGKAMAPSSSKEKLWGWIGVPVGLATGPIGLGIMGLVSNKKGRR